ncbi:MAG: WcbI family polysaccharide biosynthesis putative acetyltransferase [Synechococcaceae cyanobacterium ELA445]
MAGNCQAWPLLLYLRQLFPDAQLHHCPSVHLATPEEVSEFNHLLPSVDVLVMHRIQPGYRDNIGLDNQTLSSHLSPGARQLVLPSLHYEGHHPWIGYAHDPDGRLAQLEESSPLGPYHDFLAMAAARRGLSAQDLLRRPPPEELVRRIREQHQNSLEQLRQRETDCAVEISSWIDHHHRDVPIVHTINHPTHAALTELLGRVLQELKLSPTVEGKILETQEFLGELTIPVVPWVREALHLGNWAEAWGQKEGKVWSIGEQLAASISYYQRHPWIGEANRDNGKQRFADHCLDLLEAAPSSTRLAEEGHTSALTLQDAIWSADQPGDALRQLALDCWIKATNGEHLALDTYLQACWHTQDRGLIAIARPLVDGMPQESPWRGLYTLMLAVASHGTQVERGRIAQTLVPHAANFNAIHLRLLATCLNEEGSDASQHALTQLLPYLPEVDQWLAQPDGPDRVAKLLERHPDLDGQQRQLCASVYQRCGPSIRGPWHEWTSPSAIAPDTIDSILQRIISALNKGEGFSLIRLGDGEGVFLLGRRPNVGGATLNGKRIEPRLAANRGELQGGEHQALIQRFVCAIEDADWVGIADLPQCLHGPKELVTVAQGLATHWQGRVAHFAPKLVPGGWHIHNSLLAAGCYERPPFNCVSGLIAPSIPQGLKGQPIQHFLIPGEHWFRKDAAGEDAHYPVIYEQCLEWIAHTVQPHQLWLVGAGILGKIYCQAIRAQGGVAIDVGSVIDLSSGLGHTRGEYRQHPYLIKSALAAFTTVPS